MMTQIEQAKGNIVSKEMRKVAFSEGVDPCLIASRIADGTVIITRNVKHEIEPLGIGKGLRTKINANIGTSQDKSNIENELEKLKIVISSGADAVMDLSTGGELDTIRRTIIAESPIPVGTVPIYQAALEAVNKGKSFVELEDEEILEIIEKHADDGVDFITVHCGITTSSLEKIRNEGRIMGIVSRGGALISEWMSYNRKENPFYRHYNAILKIAKKYDMTLSLGDGLRPGCISDATDRGQIEELLTLGELGQKALSEGVQVMVEGPGHVPLNQIESNITIQKRLCHNAPFYVLGPLVTDIAPGYDHITSAIGGAIAGAAGADFLCYVTPSEHLRLPSPEDVKEGIMASRIAAHTADISKGVQGSLSRDIEMARARKALDWETQIEMSIDPGRAKKLRESSIPADGDVCTMCGTLCAIKVSGETDR